MVRLDWLPQALLGWYDENKRSLPWREDREPYHVWLSEIMLQQTRVEAVRGYYSRFLEALPTVAELADCPREELLKLWEGLGYYSRVRNLQKAARQILERHGGVFPGEYEAVRALPGVGDYTAGAVCSICFGQKKAAVDGNVLRVYARLTNDPTPIDAQKHKEAVRLALEEIYPDRAGDFTQALMELGATLCGPNREPECGKCPCADRCLARRAGTVSELPVKAPKKEKRLEEKTVFLLRCEEDYALVRRPDKGLLAGLWQLPELPGRLEAAQAAEALASMGVCVKDILRQTDKSHVFTHIRWQMRGFYMEVSNRCEAFVWHSERQILENTALPTAYRQFWEEREMREHGV